MNYTFPKDFIWGVGSSAFQTEGAILEDGKTLNIREACLAHPYQVHTLRHYTGALTQIRPAKSEFYF